MAALVCLSNSLHLSGPHCLGWTPQLNFLLDNPGTCIPRFSGRSSAHFLPHWVLHFWGSLDLSSFVFDVVSELDT